MQAAVFRLATRAARRTSRTLCNAQSSSTLGFENLVRPELVQALQTLKIFSPNAIQSEALPPALGGKDMVVCAQTGSGKTLIFLLPILQALAEYPQPMPLPKRALKHTFEDSGGGGDSSRGNEDDARLGRGGTTGLVAQPEALVLVPSRELAEQVSAVAQHLAGAFLEPDAIQVLTNGERFTPQKRALRRGSARLIIATPARLLYHVQETRAISLKKLRRVAIDECDAVLFGADGIAREGEQVLEALRRRDARTPFRRQFLLAAATIGDEHAERMRELFPNRLKRFSHAGVLVPTLEQQFHYVRGDKMQELLRLLERSHASAFLSSGATLIFCRGPRRAKQVHEHLAESMPEYEGVLLHGESSPAERSLALQRVRDDEVRVLVCSDVLARGIDLPHVNHVIMYDLPRDANAFIHRAGRTARRGQPGLVSVLVKPHEVKLYQQLRAGEATGTLLQRTSGRQPRDAATSSDGVTHSKNVRA
jgi:superfamily II DNA/RNA helicase